MKYKLLLIGAGRIGKKHLEIINEDLHENIELHIYDINNIDINCRSYGITAQFNNFNDLQKEKYDVIVICTPSGNHLDTALKFKDLSDLFIIEKPIDLDYAKAQEIVKNFKASNKKIFVVKQNRYNPPIVKVKQMMDLNLFGKIALASVRVRWTRNQNYYDQSPWRGTWKNDGGVLANQASHHADILRWMLGDIEQVSAISAAQLVNIECEDTLLANIKFKSGALGLIEATTATRPNDLEGSLSILGEKGSVVVGGFALNRIDTCKFTDDSLNEELERYSEQPKDVYGHGHRKIYKEIFKYLEKKEANLVDAEDALLSLELISMVYRSIEKDGTTVKYVDIDRHSQKLGK